jgi:hypothetical protein
MARWYRSITSYKDLIDYQKHVSEMQDARKTGGPYEFPARLHVSGEAYFPAKTKILLFHDRDRGAIRHFIKGVLSLGYSLPGSIATQVGGYAVEYIRDRGKPYMSAAGTLASIHRVIEGDTGTSFTAVYERFDDPFYDPDDFPDLY